MRISDRSSDVCSSYLHYVSHRSRISAFIDLFLEYSTERNVVVTAPTLPCPNSESPRPNFIDITAHFNHKHNFLVSFPHPFPPSSYHPDSRSAELRVGKECVITFRYWWSPYP